MEKPDLAEDPRYAKNAERVKHRKELELLIDEWAKNFSAEEIVEKMRSAGIPAGPVYTIDQVVNDTNISRERNMFVPIHHPAAGEVRITNNPIKMSLTQPEVQGSSPVLGQDNKEIYSKVLKISEEEIGILQDNKII